MSCGGTVDPLQQDLKECVCVDKLHAPRTLDGRKMLGFPKLLFYPREDTSQVLFGWTLQLR